MKKHMYFFAALLAVCCIFLSGCGVRVNSIAIAPLAAMQPGDTAQLSISYDYENKTPSEDAKEKAESALTIVYASSDESIAKVDAAGNVTAVSAGTAKITVTTDKDALQANIDVTVEQPVDTVSVTPKTVSLEIGKDKTLTVKMMPENATSGTNKTWKSSDEKIATVDNGGKVTAVSEGTATVTVTTDNGKSASSTVTVSSADDNDVTSSNVEADKKPSATTTPKATTKPKTQSSSSTTTASQTTPATPKATAAPAPAITAAPAPVVTAAPAPAPVVTAAPAPVVAEAPAPAPDPAPAPNPEDYDYGDGGCHSPTIIIPDIGEGT